jgi:ankyrin repeat protein
MDERSAGADDSGWTETERDFWFLWSAESGDEEKLRAALVEGANPNERDPERRTALMLAAMGAHLGCVNAVLAVSDATAADGGGNTALMHAARSGGAGCVAALLPASNPNARSSSGWTAIEHAAANGNLAGLRLLLPSSDKAARAGALGQAAARNYAQCVSALLGEGQADANLRGQSGAASIEMAATHGREACVRLLLAESDVENCSRALMAAAKVGAAGCVEILLAKADPTRVDEKGRDALARVLTSVGATEKNACVALLAPVSDLDRVDKEGFSAEAWAQKLGDEDSLLALRKERARREREALVEAAKKPSMATADEASEISAPIRRPLAL